MRESERADQPVASLHAELPLLLLRSYIISCTGANEVEIFSSNVDTNLNTEGRILLGYTWMEEINLLSCCKKGKYNMYPTCIASLQC